MFTFLSFISKMSFCWVFFFFGIGAQQASESTRPAFLFISISCAIGVLKKPAHGLSVVHVLQCPFLAAGSEGSACGTDTC